MTPEQLKWTDEQWAAHLGCTVQRVPDIRNVIRANFFPGIGQNKENGKFSFYMTKMDYAPSGAERVQMFLKSDKEFDSPERATKHANWTLLPHLTLTPFCAHALNVPVRALHMLHIAEKQK